MNNTIENGHVRGPWCKTVLISGMKTINQDTFVSTMDAGFTCRIMWIGIRKIIRRLSTRQAWLFILIIHCLLSLACTMWVRGSLLVNFSMLLMVACSSCDWPLCLDMKDKGMSCPHEMQLAMVTGDFIPTECDQAAMIDGVTPMHTICSIDNFKPRNHWTKGRRNSKWELLRWASWIMCCNNSR